MGYQLVYWVDIHSIRREPPPGSAPYPVPLGQWLALNRVGSPRMSVGGRQHRSERASEKGSTDQAVRPDLDFRSVAAWDGRCIFSQ
jgi:hypothetical protein